MPASRRARLAVRMSVAALAGGLALTLTACDPDLVGAAAVVGGERLTVTELHERVTDYTETLPDPSAVAGDAAAIQTALLERFVRHRLFQQLAEREGIEVTPAQVDRFLRDFAEQQGGDLTSFLAQNGFTEASVRDAVYDELARQQLAAALGGEEQVEQALAEVSAELGVQVNPRYGGWEGSSLAAASGSVSRPAGAGTPEPAPEGAPAPQ